MKDEGMEEEVTRQSSMRQWRMRPVVGWLVAGSAIRGPEM